ncbi:MAG: hypothetical protein WA139_04120 [Candidatus Aenigmatarchaeota archaeon]
MVIPIKTTSGTLGVTSKTGTMTAVLFCGTMTAAAFGGTIMNFPVGMPPRYGGAINISNNAASKDTIRNIFFFLVYFMC